jgi:hypothetical protein
MLWSSEDLYRYTIRASDGTIGGVTDFLFDDSEWTLRYLVVDTGNWLPGRRVLLPPAVLGQPDADAGEFPVSLTQEQIRNSPDIDTDRPVSRQQESDLYGFYGLTPYWVGTAGAAGTTYAPPGGYAPAADIPPNVRDPQLAAGQPGGDPHLRSASEVANYYIQASDGDIGHVETFLIDDNGWAIRYMVVDTRNWLPGRKVLVSPQWIHDIRWVDQTVHVALTRDAIESSPEYDPSMTDHREYEARLYAHYGQRPYWE